MKKILLFSLCVILLLSACSDKNEKVEIDQILTSQITAFTDTLFNTIHSQLPGMLVYVNAPQKQLNLTYCKGLSNLDQNLAISSNMSFRIASNTKTFVVTVLLQLVMEGKLSLDDPLSQWYPDFPQSNQITIRELCNMTSGIYDYREAQELNELLSIRPLSPPPIDSLIAIARDKGLNFNPGAQYEYSNTNTLIIGKIIEAECGHSLAYELKHRIFEPLGLNSTYLAEDMNFPTNLMCGYGDINNTLLESTNRYHPNYAWAAGSVISNLRDMKIWLKALAKGSLLNQEMQNQRLNFVQSNEISSYGLGIMESYGFLGHSGGMPGYLSIAVYNPEKDCTVIIFYNSSLISPSIYLAIHLYSILDIIYPELGIDLGKNQKSYSSFINKM